jgi:dnd system-associated protein 4
MTSLSKELANKEVRRNNKYNAVVNLLVYGEIDGDESFRGQKIFPYIKDLIIFSAMVGKRYNAEEEVEKDNTKIILGTFEGGVGSNRDTKLDQHNIIFMFGLSTLRDMKYMRDENVDELIQIFERYSNGGLAIIFSWIRDAAWNPLVLLDKIVDELKASQKTLTTEISNPF